MTSHYHLIGIGGIGMSGIARLLLHKGQKVSGSDLRENNITQELKELGAQIFSGHRAENIGGADVIVYSSAIREDNAEILQARSKGLPLIKRAQALARLMEDETAITVAGSHGKTTTSSLSACLLLKAGLCPTIAVGGVIGNISANASLGAGKFFVAEADESDGSFLFYRPEYSIITNIDFEHLDYYKDFKNEVAAFKEFINNTRPGGCVFACGDDQNLRTLLRDYGKRHVLFGLKPGGHIYPEKIEMNGLSSAFDCVYKGKFIERFVLALGGKHNISNALAVIALGLELGISTRFIKDALSGYKGAKRRLEVKFNDNGLLLVDDYAHHPTEIQAALSALMNFKSRRIIAVFQPHRYTRTGLLYEEFAKSFDSADQVILTDIYSAGEPPVEGVNAGIILDKMKARFPGKQICLLPKEKIVPHVLEIAKPGDLLVTLGAGDIVKICDELAQKLKRQD